MATRIDCLLLMEAKTVLRIPRCTESTNLQTVHRSPTLCISQNATENVGNVIGRNGTKGLKNKRRTI